ncbi:hypothetical protein [Roseivirga sp. E12]|uniref:hypothetical protein n=1 Tax=Roseivirga sp. E12 TaxID=2819237 RepID=UPI001ABC8DB1|nr:hypothetical protein [Roseivirga sp. E12]MBO3697873.1 hypothetical protein [Roseivirga sp. E12]
MNRVSITVCLLLFALCANAQISDLNGWIDETWRPLNSPSTSRSDGSSHRKPNRRQRIQAFPPVWNHGSVLLSDGSLLEGVINYNVARDIVRINSSDTVRILAANQIQHFEVYKNLPRVRRNSVDTRAIKAKYYSLPYVIRNGYSRPKLFEMVVDGNTSLLRRWVYGTRYSDRKLYLKNPEGKITRIKKRRGQVIQSFDGKYDELKQIAKRERLDMYDVRDVMRLVQAYNQLMDQ